MVADGDLPAGLDVPLLMLPGGPEIAATYIAIAWAKHNNETDAESFRFYDSIMEGMENVA